MNELREHEKVDRFHQITLMESENIPNTLIASKDYTSHDNLFHLNKEMRL